MSDEPIRIDSTSWTGEIEISDPVPPPPPKPPSRLKLWLIGIILFLFSLWQVIAAFRTGYVSLRHRDVGFYEDPGTFSAMLLLWMIVGTVTGLIMAWKIWRRLVPRNR